MNNSNCCAICCQIAGQKDGDLLAELIGSEKEYVRRIILESEHFVVFPSIGPLKVGHVILCPKLHYPSFACLPGMFEDEYQAVKTRLSELLEATFGEKVHLFEHGTDAWCSRIPCSVEHAHQHFIPTNANVWDTLYSDIEWRYISLDISSLERVTTGREYLLYHSPEDFTLIAIAPENGFESQYIRRVFANALGKSEQWNWRTHPHPLDIEETFTALRGAKR
jgi:ATP adenylyltransferase